MSSADPRRLATQLELLEVLLNSSNGEGSLGDKNRDYDLPFSDRGSWRGIAIKELRRDGVIEPVGASKSKRPTRNKTIVNKWRLLDREHAYEIYRSLNDRLKSFEKPTKDKKQKSLKLE
jgi:hypothetical protein